MRWALFLAVASLLPVTEGARHHEPARKFLSMAYELSESDIGRLDAGQVVSRTLHTNNAREVATLGIVRIATTPENYVAHLTDIARFKRTDDVLQIGTFSEPPQIGDVAALTIEEADLRRLAECRVEDCGLRISAEAIQQFRKMDWRAADAQQVAAGVMKQLLVDYVIRYQATGAAALMTYANRSQRLDVSAELAGLVDSDKVTWPHLDDLRRHVLDYPHAHTLATDLIYWSKERVYKRPVISITHVSIMRQTDNGPIRFAVASKQIYAMHYFDASLGLTLLIPDTSSSSPETFVVYLNRSRIDLFDGLFGGIAKRIVSGKARALVASELGRLQRQLGPQSSSPR